MAAALHAVGRFALILRECNYFACVPTCVFRCALTCVGHVARSKALAEIVIACSDTSMAVRSSSAVGDDRYRACRASAPMAVRSAPLANRLSFLESTTTGSCRHAASSPQRWRLLRRSVSY